MESRTYYYTRVSSADQNPDRQFMAFRKPGTTEREIIVDKAKEFAPQSRRESV